MFCCAIIKKKKDRHLSDDKELKWGTRVYFRIPPVSLYTHLILLLNLERFAFFSHHSNYICIIVFISAYKKHKIAAHISRRCTYQNAILFFFSALFTWRPTSLAAERASRRVA